MAGVVGYTLLALLFFSLPSPSSAASVDGEVEIEGSISAGTQPPSADCRGAAFGISDEELPAGLVEVPSAAEEARIEVEVDESIDAGDPSTFGLWVFEEANTTTRESPAALWWALGSCPEDGLAEWGIAHSRGGEQLELAVPVEDRSALGWLVFPWAEETPVVETEVRGHVRFASTPEATPTGGDASPTLGSPRPEQASTTSSPLEPGTLAALGGILALGVTAAAAGARPRRWLPAPLLGLFHRIDRDELLDHPTRRRIHDLVADEPGIHFSELRRRTDTSPGNLDHHLHRMVEEGLLEHHESAGYRCFFLPGAIPDEIAETLDRVRSPTARRVLAHLASNRATTGAELAEALGRAPSTIAYHVDRLSDAGLVDREDSGDRVELTPTERGRSVVDLLDLDEPEP